MKSYHRGINLIELLIAITITAIVAIPMVNALRSMLSTWNKGSNQLETIKTSHLSFNPLLEKLRFASHINTVSLSNNSFGYIQYTDTANRIFTVFYNSDFNKNFFNVPNNFPENSLVFFRDELSPTPELLIQHISLFSIETYAEDSSLFFRVVSPNNTSDPDYNRIISLKINATISKDGFEESLEQLIDLAKTPFDASSTLSIGDDSLTFMDMLSSYDSIEINENNIAFNGDVLSLPSFVHPIKILHTSRYFDTISDALDVAQSGDIILVGYVESGYIENFIVPEGVTIRGGYNPLTWERDLIHYPSKIYIREGINLIDSVSSIIAMEDNATIDGLVLDAKDLTHAIYAKNVNNITIMNTQIDNVDVAMYLENISGSLIQNSVTANISGLSITNSTEVSIIRNSFTSFNQLSVANVLLRGNNSVLFANNYITGGYIGLSILNSINQTLANNAITQADYFGLSIINLNSSTMYNNIIAKNNIGVFLDITTMGDFASSDFNYNFLANNEFSQSNNLPLNGTNIAVNLSDYIWENENPYFSDIHSFMLKSSPPSSPLIDAGFGSNEVYTNGNPSLGNSTNDIGLYGGAYSGRVGIPVKFLFTTALSNTAILNLIEQSYPGDFLFFNSGTYDITQTIILKPYQYLGGLLSNLSLLNHLGSSSLIDCADHTIIEQLAFQGNQHSILSATSVDHVSISQLIFKDASNAINIATTSANIQFCTFYNCTTGINITNTYTGSINFNIFESNVLGINNNTNTAVFSSHNLFYNNGTFFSGSVIEDNNVSNDYSSFRNADSNRFELISTSNAINKHLDYDSGAIDYFHHFGQYISMPIQNPIDRFYKTLRIDYAHPPETFQVLSGVTIGFMNNNKSITLNTQILIDSEDLNSVTVDLPPSIIADDMQLIIQLDSFTFGRSPYIDDITLSW